MGLGRRGISPLIATVLLMAFAVAIGGMIMNWSSDIGETILLGCSKVEVENVNICLADKAISLWIRNTGEQDVAGVTVTTDFDGEVLETRVPNSAIPEGESLRKEVPVFASPGTRVSIFARISKQNEEHVCEEPFFGPLSLSEC